MRLEMPDFQNRRQMPDSQMPDVLCSFYCRLCLEPAFVFYFIKTNVVGRLWLPMVKAFESCSNSRLWE